MNATRTEGGDTVLTLSPEEAHVLIWGGPTDLYEGLYGQLRTTLVEVEDKQMSEAEYRERFGVLDDMYAVLKIKHDKWREEQKA